MTNEMVIFLDVVPDVKVIMEDVFDPQIFVNRMGSRNNLIICMLVNARTMNIETGLATFFQVSSPSVFLTASPGEHWSIVVSLSCILLAEFRRCRKICSSSPSFRSMAYRNGTSKN